MINLQILRPTCLNNKDRDLNKNLKIPKGKGFQQTQIEAQRGRNTRQFGTNITNICNLTIDQNHEALIKKKSLDKKYSVQIGTNYVEEIRLKKQSIQVPNCSVDMTSQTIKMDICNNSFGGSSMMLDFPVLTRNQCTEIITKTDPQLVMEYIEDISKSLHETESCVKGICPTPNYMKDYQSDINEKMRAILFDWLVDVHLKWKLSAETLYLTFNLIDRYLALKPTLREELQCVGVSALLIACKYEEIYFPEIVDFREITDNTFSKEQILKKELDILSKLEFDVTVPSALRFFEICNIYLKLEGRDKSCALYLLELAAFDYQMLKYKPSLIAASCLMLIVQSNKSLKEKLFMHCNHTRDDISVAFKDLIKMFQRIDHGSKSITRKYSSAKYHFISSFDILIQTNSPGELL